MHNYLCYVAIRAVYRNFAKGGGGGGGDVGGGVGREEGSADPSVGVWFGTFEAPEVVLMDLKVI